MGYEINCTLPMLIGAALAIVLGLFITLSRLQDWAAKQLIKNSVTIVVYKAGKEYKYSFSTVKDAAANAIEQVGKGERVAYIEKDGEKVWDAFSTTNKSLW